MQVEVIVYASVMVFAVALLLALSVVCVFHCCKERVADEFIV